MAINKDTLILSIFNEQWSNDNSIKVYPVTKSETLKRNNQQHHKNGPKIYLIDQSRQINTIKTTMMIAIIGAIAIVLILLIVFCAYSKCCKVRASEIKKEEFD